MTAAGALTVIAISIALIALIQVAGILMLLRVAAQLTEQVKQLQARAEALERLVAQTAERVSTTADDIGRTARSLGQAAGAFGRVMQGAGVGAWLLRRFTAGAAPLAVAGAEAAAGAARLALMRAGLELAGSVVRAVASRRTGNGDAAAPRSSEGPPLAPPRPRRRMPARGSAATPGRDGGAGDPGPQDA